MVTIPFLKKIQFPKLDFSFGIGSRSYVGIDIGSDSAKVVQLRRERERAILETYGELKATRYFQREAAAVRGGFLGSSDQSLVDLLTDVLRESNVTTTRAVFSLPATASFITLVRFPLLKLEEIEAAVPFEAKKYIPIPVEEVALDWQVIEEDQEDRRVDVLLAAIPREIVTKYQRVAELAKLQLEAVEIESFSLVRALLATDRGVSALMNWGALATTITVVDERRVRLNHNFGRGSREITTALAQSLGVSTDRAEAIKRDVGLSEKPEEKETVDVILPIVDSTLADLERVMLSYNRSAKRKIEKVVLTGGGASLAGLVNHVARRFSLETSIGDPFARTIFPAFLAPVLKEITPTFGVAVGLALRPITPT